MMDRKNNGGRKIFYYFTAFFAFIGLANAVFVFMALRTHSGTVTDHAYEKGLAYNETLTTSKSQPKLKDKAAFNGSTFEWIILDEQGNPLIKADTQVTFFRPVKGGEDFTLPLSEVRPGIYETKPDFPVPGIWTAQLDATWDNKTYRTAQTIMVK